jgi:RepB DNA-primase from phage plasmid
MSDTLQTRADRLAAMKGQIDYFFGQERGYFPLDAGIRDDSAPTGIQMLLPSDDSPDIPNSRTWHYHDPERPDLLDAAAEIALQKADTYGNVYLTRTLFDRKRATKDSAKPSHIIAIEDAPADLPLPASRVLRTSPQSRQSFYRLTEPVSTSKAERLSRLIARAMKADKSGVNANKVLRLCGGYNTKAKCGDPFLVYVESRARDYTYQELWDAYSALLTPSELADVEAKSQHDRAVICWPDAKEQWVTHWCKHIGVLMDGRMPRVFKYATYSQGYKIFGDPSYIAEWRHEGGSWDASTVRWVRAANLVRGGCTDEMTAAILQTVEDPETIRIKGKNAVYNDIRQCVTQAREHESDHKGRTGYDLVGDFARTRQPAYDIPATGQTDAAPNHGGRPAALIADTLLTFYQEHANSSVVLMTRAEVAATLHVSPATIYRLNAELKTRGEIAIEHADNRQRSIIRLLRLVKTPTAAAVEMTRSDAPIQSVTTPQTANEPPQAIETHVVLSPDPARVVAPLSPDADEQHKMRSSQTTLEPIPAIVSVAPPTLLAAIGEALDALPGERANNRTGELQTWPRTNKRVLCWLEEHYPEVWSQWKRYAPRQIARVRKLRRNTVFNEIRDMPAKALEQAHASCARTIAKFEKRAKLETDAAICASWEREANKRRGRLAILGQERADRQQAEAKRIERIGYSLAEQAEMLELVDQVRPDQPRIGRAARIDEPDPAAPRATDGWSVIARLQAAAAQRQAVQHG